MKYAPITLTAEAAEKVSDFLTAADDETASLRLGIIGGGCSGFQYQLAIDHERDGDHRFESEGQAILVADSALPLVAGSEIFYRTSLQASGFDVNNPNATSGCGCGSSFRVDGTDGCDSDSELSAL